MGGLCSIAIKFKIFEMMLSCSIFKKKQIRFYYIHLLLDIMIQFLQQVR
jgi:hypothetical protein